MELGSGHSYLLYVAPEHERTSVWLRLMWLPRLWENQRATLFRRMNAFFDTYDLLLCPATIVAAYPAEKRYVSECAGHSFSNYVEWLAIAYAITLTAAPALSLPCGFTGDGRPVGLQIVGRARAEGGVLAGARALEDILGLRGTTPIDPRSPRAMDLPS